MNRRMVLYMVGQIVKLEAALLVLPLGVSAIYSEWPQCLAFAITIIAALAVGFALTLISRPENEVIFAKEGFVIVALAWLLLSAIGALPFTICGDIPSYVDALFETVSGFTTTGSSILTDVEAMSKGMLFWRSFTHWIGGMGVLVLIMAIMPSASGRAMHIMRAEVPGPTVGKLVPRIKSTAKILYLMYIVFTVVEAILLLCGGLDLFESVVYAFGTAGTGGFGIKADSLASYSPYVQWVITVFMLLFSINFNVYYLIILRRFSSVLKSSETWCFLGIFAVATAIITGCIHDMYSGFAEALRHSAFQTASVISTTGFATTNFDMWPQLAKSVLFVLMFIGGCAGSTAGGLKMSRVMLLCKVIRRNLQHMIHPRSVSVVKIEGRKVDDETIDNLTSYFALYFACFAGVFLLISFDKFDFVTNITAVTTCLNNVGPGFNVIGPMGSFAGYSDASKLLLTLTMLVGRLEIYPIILTLIPSTWKKN